jgi:hypothetical protein
MFTTDEYRRMTELGILGEDDHLELINGEILCTAVAAVDRLNHLFAKLLSDTVIIGVRNSVTIGEYSEPEPDIALLKPRPDFYAEAHPGPEDVLLIVEVADTSLE